MMHHALSSRALRRAVLAMVAVFLLVLVMENHASIYLERYTGAVPWKVFKSKDLSTIPDNLDWSDYAYCQYATKVDYLCNSLMIFESLERLGSKAARIMMYPQDWSLDAHTDKGRLLVKARDDFHVLLQPVQVQHLDPPDGHSDKTWADSFTKLLAFSQTSYKRVLSLDSDATVLQSMDELFLLPPSSVAMPRAYWLADKATLASQLVLVQPSEFEMSRVLEAFRHRTDYQYDMGIVNHLYGKDCMIIPHRRYGLISGEFRLTEHHLYLGSTEETWDPDIVYREAKYLHFSDWPLPKPWKWSTQEEKDDIAPECHAREHGTQDCRDRDTWFSLY